MNKVVPRGITVSFQIRHYEDNLAALIKDLRKEFSDLPGGKDLPVSIGVTGLNGWPSSANKSVELAVGTGDVGGNIDKYLIPAQFAVADASKHPEFAGNVLTAETRDFHHPASVSPGGQGYHWNNNCDSYWRVGKVMGENMVKLIKNTFDLAII